MPHPQLSHECTGVVLSADVPDGAIGGRLCVGFKMAD